MTLKNVIKRGIISTLVVATVFSTSISALAVATTFSDIPSTHWAYSDIMTLADKGVVGGISRDEQTGISVYDPNGTVTLGQFLAISTRLVASDKIKEKEPTDVSWASPNFNAAIEAGLMGSRDFQGTAESLASGITREDMAYILVNIAKVNGETLTIATGAKESIKDFNTISLNRQNAVLQAYSVGLLGGYTNGNFGPKDILTRAQVAAVFCRVMNYTTRTAPTFNTPTTPTFNGFVSDEGDSKGMLLSKYSRQYDLEALSLCRVGTDSKGVYVTFTAPQLPSEIKDSFIYYFSSNLYKSNGDYFADSVTVELKSGESKTVYYQTFAGGSVSTSAISDMYVAVAIFNDNNSYLLTHRVDLTSKTKALEGWFTGEHEVVDFDSTAIFAGIGK